MQAVAQAGDIFHQNLNGDGTIGLVTMVSDSSGSTSLTEVVNNFLPLQQWLCEKIGASAPGTSSRALRGSIGSPAYTHVVQAHPASPDLLFSTIPPATPTPSTYIHPSWKSNRCELNSEVIIF